MTEKIILIEDNDDAGKKAVAATAKRLAQQCYQINIVRPIIGKDLNAALLQRGLCEPLFTTEDYEPAGATGDWYSKCLEGSDGRTLCNVTNALLALREDPAWQSVISRDGMLWVSVLIQPKPKEKR
jgi:hypothetical protein